MANSARPGGAKKIIPMVNGARWTSASSESVSLMPNGSSVAIPLIDEAMLQAIFKQENSGLGQVSMGEIIGFLKNVGRNWKSRDYVRRRIYIRELTGFYGYSEKMAEYVADWIALILCSDFRLHDMVQNELGSWHAMDRWLMREECHVKAFPIGTLLHLLPGNVPLSTLESLVRGLLTKNDAILKISSADPFTPTALVQSLADIDASHPIAKSASTVYWEHDHPLGKAVSQKCDGIIAWGGAQVQTWAHENASDLAEVVNFGPKHSCGLLDEDADVDVAAKACAFDVGIFDQNACFSLRRVFVHERIFDDFIESMKVHLKELEEVLPKGSASMDAQAANRLMILEAEFLDGNVHRGNGWTLIADEAAHSTAHCLGRTLYVQKISDIREALGQIDKNVQTVGVMPPSSVTKVRDDLAGKGVSRIVELGLSNVFRVGGSHDGIYPMQRLVRWVNHELPSEDMIKGINVRVDQTDFIREERLLTFVP